MLVAVFSAYKLGPGHFGFAPYGCWCSSLLNWREVIGQLMVNCSIVIDLFVNILQHENLRGVFGQLALNLKCVYVCIDSYLYI